MPASLHIDRTLEARPILEADARSDQIALHVTGGLDNDLLKTKEIAAYPSFDPDGLGMNICLNLACLSDSDALTLDDDLAVDLTLNQKIFLA